MFPVNIKTEWNTLLEHSITRVPFLRYEYLMDWWQTRGGGEWQQAELAMISAEENGRLKGVAPLFFSADKGVPALYWLGAAEISDYLDWIVTPDYLPDFIPNVLAELDRLEFPWKQLILENVLEDSPGISVLEQAALARGWKFEKELLQNCPLLNLPGDWDSYLAGIDKKQRHEIRRKMRRAAESYPLSLCFAGEDRALDADIEVFLGLMENDTEKAKFLTPGMRRQMKQFIHTSHAEGYLNLAFLKADGVAAAAYLNMDYQNRLWVYNSGMNPEYLNISPGWVLLGRLIQWAIQHGKESLDFMRGDEVYKYCFGGKARKVVRLLVTRRPD